LAIFPHTITSLSAVKMPRHDTTYYCYYPRAGEESGDNQYYITPAHTPAKVPGRVVEFVLASNTICRPARDDECYVMQCFAAHASHCPRCENPCRVYIMGGTLCERGHAYARDIAQYVYSKAGKAYSVIDRSATDARVQIEIPPNCDAIRGLLRAVDKGLKVRGPASRPVVTHDRTSDVPDRRPLPDRRDGYEVMEVAPRRREDRRRAEGGDWRRGTVYVSGRGSLHEKHEKERRQQRKERGEPVIVYAKPRLSKTAKMK
jgi:hypothetical protein